MKQNKIIIIFSGKVLILPLFINSYNMKDNREIIVILKAMKKKSRAMKTKCNWRNNCSNPNCNTPATPETKPAF